MDTSKIRGIKNWNEVDHHFQFLYILQKSYLKLKFFLKLMYL